MICYTISLILIILLFILIYKYKENNNKYLKKIQFLNTKINKIIDEKKELKFESYYNIFKNIRHIYTHFKPDSITFYRYYYNHKLKNTLLKFLCEIKSNNDNPIFTGTNNNIPITNIDAVTKVYFFNNALSLNIEELSKYDSGLYEKLKKNNVNRLYLINIYDNDICKQTIKHCTKNKPIGLFALTYKNKILTDAEVDILIEETEKTSKHLINIL